VSEHPLDHLGLGPVRPPVAGLFRRRIDAVHSSPSPRLDPVKPA
jgi:hypothetical protein